jgi:hypothetical protein
MSQRFSDLLVLVSKWARFGFIHGWPFSDCGIPSPGMGSIWSADCRAVVWTADNRNNRLVHTERSEREADQVG